MAPKPIVAQRTLYDIRDSNSYTIAKLADGNCWMTQNLRLTGRRTLTSANSNVSSNWTLPAANTSFPTSCVNTAYNMSSGNTTYGNYYNWYAATAGTGTCSMSSGNASSSICPKGWRLPTSGGAGEFRNLNSKYGSSASMRQVPMSFPLAGGRSGTNTMDQGSFSSYWSSTVYTAGIVYCLGLDSSNVYASFNYNGKELGTTVRCVAQ